MSFTGSRVAGVVGIAVGGFLGVLFTAAAASAEEPLPPDEAERVIEELDIGELEKECLELLIHGKGVDACQQSPEPMLPPRDEILWNLVGFGIVAGAFAKFGVPAARKALASRTNRIRSDVDAAASARHEAEAVAAEYRAQLAAASAEAHQIVTDARATAEQVRREHAERTDAELEAMRARAEADVGALWAQSADDVRRDVVALVAEATEHVVRNGLDPAVQARLVDDYIASLERRRN